MDARQTNCSDGLTAFGCSSFALFAMLFYHQYYIDYVAYFSNFIVFKRYLNEEKNAAFNLAGLGNSGGKAGK